MLSTQKYVRSFENLSTCVFFGIMLNGFKIWKIRYLMIHIKFKYYVLNKKVEKINKYSFIIFKLSVGVYYIIIAIIKT